MPTLENRNKYKNALVAFLSYRDGVAYSKDAEFGQDVFSSITDADIVKWLKYKAYGTPTPGEFDLPIVGRSSTLFFHKKAISFFIPNKHLKWNVETLCGNPTTSPAVNDLIKTVRKHEVRAEGVPSQARRPISPEEFRLLIRIAERGNEIPLQIRLPTMAKFQLHLIARIDDTAHVKCNDLSVHPNFDFALSIRLRWTKNCMEERDAPEQIIIGSMDSEFCLIAALSIYIQYVLEFTNAAQSDLLFCDGGEDPVSLKNRFRICYTDIF
jgi:hypothetical protein